jgi:ferredoxin
MMTKYRVSKGCCGCGTCVYECPVHAIRMTVSGGAQIDENACTGCGACYDNCASEAIERIEARDKRQETNERE